MAIKYYRYPFAESGDREDIPDTTSQTTISYEKGYPQEYEKDPLTQKGHYIERNKFNSMMFDVTSNIKQWQDFTYPEWREKSSYRKNAIVSHNGYAFKSLEDKNNNEPKEGFVENGTWVSLDESAVIPVGTIISFPKAFTDDNGVPIYNLLSGFEICQGQPFNPDKYPILAKMFEDHRIPDLQGLILKGTPYGETTGIFQKEQVGSHTHEVDCEYCGDHDHDYVLGARIEGHTYREGWGGSIVNPAGGIDTQTHKTSFAGGHKHKVTIVKEQYEENLVNSFYVDLYIKVG